MKTKHKVYFGIVGLGIAGLIVSLATNVQPVRLSASPTSYELTLNENNAPNGLTSSYQNNLSSTVSTDLGNTISITVTDAKSLANGYVTLGNYGTVYCITNDEHHISGLTSIKVTFSGGSLKLKSSSVDTQDGSSYITNTLSITNGTTHALDAAANSFVLQAQEASVDITEIKFTYSCSASSSSYDFSQTYLVDDFSSYNATGVGYDSSHGMGITTGLRSAFYSTYYGNGTDPLNGSGWSVMGSTDYLTYNSNLGIDGSACALLKTNSSNYFSYIQAKHFFGVPTAIGKGSKLSVWMHGAYTGWDNPSTLSSYNTTVTLIAYYNKQLNRGGSNDGATAQHVVLAGSGWCEYTLDLDPTKTVYAFGIYFKKASGTLYLPIDNVRIYSTYPKNNWPVGNFMKVISVNSNDMPTIFSFSDDRKAVEIKFSNKYDPSITGYSYNETTKQFTITTNGSYSAGFISVTYGTITGYYDATNNQLTGVGLSGSIKNYVDGNGSLTFSQTQRYWNCDGTTNELRSIFKRRYGGTLDDFNTDRINSVTYNRNSGYSAMKIRLWSGGLTQLNLQQDINESCGNIGFWVYSSFTTDKTIRLWTYAGANLSNNTEHGSMTAKAGQWTFVCMGFNTQPLTIKNFQLGFDSYNPDNGYILIDDISLY